MGNLRNFMQGYVMDRPVVDQTGIEGRYDFTLDWTPDEFQFSTQGVKAPPAPDNGQYGKGRMVPDVCANADPNTGYNIFVHGSATVVGGTSAVAPLYAGLFAAFGTKLGFVSPTFWQNQKAFNDITVGSNGIYDAAPGPDACSGIGSPIGASIAAMFKSGS